MNRIFIARQRELTLLEKLLNSDRAELLAIYGRRRIGKTFLISEYFKTKGLYFELTGMKKARIGTQLENFAHEFADKFNQGIIGEVPKSWSEAMQQLRKAVEKISSNRNVILFFDELPWLATPRSRLLSALDHVWNRYLSRCLNVKVIVCGSAAAWMIKHVIDDKGGLHGRVTQQIRLLPFTLKETEQYLLAEKIELPRKQIVDLYMVTGGVAKYLSNFQRGLSVAENIQQLCFTKDGPLLTEFNRLYQSLFDSAEWHIAVIQALANRPSGLFKNEIIESAGLSSGGRSSTIIQELVESGFILPIPEFNKKRKDQKYKLIDEYSLFYLTWIAQYQYDNLQQPDIAYWQQIQNSQKYAVWAGHSFETLCLKHLFAIKHALGISGVMTRAAQWQIAGNKTEADCEIDLLIERADNCINLFEFKFYNDEFVINKHYADALRRKKALFLEKTQTNKALMTTLLTSYGAKRNKHYLGVVDKSLTIDDLFE